MTAGPGPLEVVAAQPARDVHDLTNEIQAFLGRFHGFLRQGLGGHAAHRDLGFSVAFRPCGLQGPRGQGLGQVAQGAVAGLVDGALPLGVTRHPGVGKPRGQPLGQFVGNAFAGAEFGIGQGLDADLLVSGLDQLTPEQAVQLETSN